MSTLQTQMAFSLLHHVASGSISPEQATNEFEKTSSKEDVGKQQNEWWRKLKPSKPTDEQTLPYRDD